MTEFEDNTILSLFLFLETDIPSKKRGKKVTWREESSALIICTRTSLLSCGGHTRPHQLWHSALPRLQPSCSTRISLEPEYSTDRARTILVLQSSRCPSVSFLLLPSSRARLLISPFFRGGSLFCPKNFNYNRNYRPESFVREYPRGPRNISNSF